MNNLIIDKVVNCINTIYDFFKEEKTNFENKFLFIRQLTIDEVLNNPNREKMFEILKSINRDIDSKMFYYESYINNETLNHIIDILTKNQLIEINYDNFNRKDIEKILRSKVKDLNNFIEQHVSFNDMLTIHFLEFKRQIQINIYIKYNEQDNRILFHYSPIPTYSGDWNNLTIISRGIVYDLDLNKVVAHSYDKFHNYMEKEYLLPHNLPKCGYEIVTKLDGSEGILYPPKENSPLRIITKGGFDSEQGKFATELLYSKYKNQVDFIIKHKLWEKYTITFEILYDKSNPNKIVVNYDEPDLKVIGIRDLQTGECLPYEVVIESAKQMGFPATDIHDLLLDDILKLSETMSNFEGWVVRYSNGLYMKIKCKEYLESHGARFGTSPKYVFLLLQQEKYDDFISSVKEEFQYVPNNIRDSLVSFVEERTKKIHEIYDSIPKFESQKDFALYVQQNIDKEYMGYMFELRNKGNIDLFKRRWSEMKHYYKEWLDNNK
jgi:RNA ligase.